MKKLLTLFLTVFTLLAFAGEEIKLTEKDFLLGDYEVDGGKYSVTYEDGVFTVSIPEQPGITNETRGAIFNIPLKNLVGKGLQIRGEVRYENITSEGSPHAGGKILVY